MRLSTVSKAGIQVIGLSILCHLAVCRRGLSLSAVGRCLGVFKQSVARALERATPILVKANGMETPFR